MSLEKKYCAKKLPSNYESIKLFYPVLAVALITLAGNLLSKSHRRKCA